MGKDSGAKKIPGTHVLHEVLFALYGVKSTFYSPPFAFKELFEPSEALLLEKILNLGHDYYNIKSYIDSMEGNQLCEDKPIGLYLLAFTEHLDQVFEPYRTDVVDLEHEILENPQNSLHYIWSKIYKHAELLSGMNCLIREITHQKSEGCILLQHLQERLSSDVGSVRSAVQFLTQGVNKILYRQLSEWLLYGDLKDRFNEFFIQRNSQTSGEAEFTPFEEYSINCQMLPNHIGLPLAEKILNVGLTVLFLRSNPENTLHKDKSKVMSQICINETGMFGEKEIQMRNKMASAQKVSKWNENGLVERLVVEVCSCGTLQLWTLAVHDARLIEQLKLVKQFFLLGRGELFYEFVVQTDRLLQKGMTRNIDLNQILQESARKILMKEECLQRFSLELLKPDLEGPKPNKYEGDWGRVNVKYDIPWPLQLLFTSHVLASYNSIFRYLLRLKKIEVKMIDCWLCEKSKKLEEHSLKRRHLQRNLWFLINNLQYYLHVDVLDSQFMIFEAAVESSKDFEDIHRAHTVFLGNLISQLFIEVESNPESMKNLVYHIMNKIVELCEEYCMQVGLHKESKMSEELINSLLFKLEACVEYSVKVLSRLTKQASHPCSKYLSQFLLRLDFNSFFSNQFSSETNFV